MASSLANPVNNLAEGIYKIRFKYRHNDNDVKLAEFHLKIASGFLKTQTLKII